MSKDSPKLTQSCLPFAKPVLKRKREEEEVPSLHHDNPSEGAALDKELENLPKPSPKCRKISQETSKVLSEKNTNNTEPHIPDDHVIKKPHTEEEVPYKEKVFPVKTPPPCSEQKEAIDIESESSGAEQDVSREQCSEQEISPQEAPLNENTKEKSSESDEADTSACNVSITSTGKSPSKSEPKPADQQDSDLSLNRTLSLSPSGSQRPSRTKKKKMSVDEAKAKAEERENRLKKKQEEARQKQFLQEKKQAEKEEKLRERQKKKEQEEKEKQEKLREKEEKTKAKLEEKKKKDEEKKKREEERKKKEEERKKKEEEKEEERKKKEEERKKKEEEKKKREEEKKKKEEEKEKTLMKTKEVFKKFFLKSQTTPKTKVQTDTATTSSPFLPFQVQKDMTLAPVVPAIAVGRFKCAPLDQYLEQQDSEANYLQDLRSSHHIPHTCAKPPSSGPLNPDIPQYRAKLLQFSENVRPPYWGTWRKKSKFISPRNPFKEDKDLLDYEVDSDEEWDEGGPGESLEGTEDEKESDKEEDASDEDDFIVPHGYLSAEEEEEEDDRQEVDHERMKEELKLREKGFYKEIEAERRKKSSLKPFLVGCLWQSEPREAKEEDWECLLSSHSAVLIHLEACSAALYPPTTPIPVDGEYVPEDSSANEEKGSRKKVVSEAAMPHLIKLFHGNNNSRVSLIKEFMTFWRQQQNPESSGGEFISQRQLAFKLQEICVWHKEKPSHWVVKDEVREKYGLGDLSLNNQWNYVTTVPRPVVPSSASTSPRAEELPEPEENEDPQTPLSAVSTPSIRRFITITPRSLPISPSFSERSPAKDKTEGDEAMDVD